MICSNCGGAVENGRCIGCGQVVDLTGTFKFDTAIIEVEPEVEFGAMTQAALVVLRGPQAGEVWTLEGEAVEVGRAPDSGLFLDDITVSRHHALISRHDGDWQIEDRGSLNGTYVDRQQIAGVTKLTDGCELQIGKFKFRFVAGVEA